MKDQHEKIDGYWDLDRSEIDEINRIKGTGNRLGVIFDDLATRPGIDGCFSRILVHRHLPLP